MNKVSARLSSLNIHSRKALNGCNSSYNSVHKKVVAKSLIEILLKMKVQRLKSIDVFRGLCMFWIVLTHLIDWWLKSEFVWLHRITVMLFDSFGASGLLFISIRK